MRAASIASIAALAGVVLLSTLGCGSKGDPSQSGTAAINGSQSGKSDDKSGGNTASEKPNADRLHPVVVLETAKGDITVRLDAAKAELTVENFLHYAASKHYEGTVFHQVFKGQCVVGGGYTAELKEKTTDREPVRNEANNGLKNIRGTIAMVRGTAEIDSARSQFLFNLADNDALDHKDDMPAGYGYCVFGEVISGMDVLDAIAAAPVEDGPPPFDRKPAQSVTIKTVRRVK